MCHRVIVVVGISPRHPSLGPRFESRQGTMWIRIPVLTRAQFHRAAKQTNLLSMTFFALIKTGLPTKFPREFQDKQTTAEYMYNNKQYATIGNLVGNRAFIKKDI